MNFLMGESCCDFFRFSIANCLILSYTVGYFLILGGFNAASGVKFCLSIFGL